MTHFADDVARVAFAFGFTRCAFYASRTRYVCWKKDLFFRISRASENTAFNLEDGGVRVITNYYGCLNNRNDCALAVISKTAYLGEKLHRWFIGTVGRLAGRSFS